MPIHCQKPPLKPPNEGIELFVNGIKASVSFANFVNYRWDGMKQKDENLFRKDYNEICELFTKFGGENPGPWVSIPLYWSALVKEMMEKIAKTDPEIAFLQIKEKWLALTVYFASNKRNKVQAIANDYIKKVKKLTNDRIAEAKKLGIGDGVR